MFFHKQKYPDNLSGKEQRLIFDNPPGYPVEKEPLVDAEPDELVHPGEAPPLDVGDTQARIKQAVEETVANPKQLVETIHSFIENHPVEALMDALKRNGQLQQVKEAMVPYCMAQLQEYVKQRGKPECQNFTDYITGEDQLLLALLFAKDEWHAKHTLDLYITTDQALKKVPSLQNLDEDSAYVIKRAVLLHDVGKANQPALIFNNPVPREEQWLMLEDYLARTDRKPVETPKQFTEEERGDFDLLLNKPQEIPGGKRAELAEDFAKLCKERGIDHRGLIPIGFFLEYSYRLLEQGGLDEKTRNDLEKQRVDLKNRNEILRRYSIPTDRSFKDCLDTHEADSLLLVTKVNTVTTSLPPSVAADLSSLDEETGIETGTETLLARVLHTLSRHHNNPGTVKIREELPITANNQPPSEDTKLHQAIVLIDIYAAGNGEPRPYFKPWGPEKTGKILREEAAKRKIDSELLEAFIAEFVK